MTHKLAIDVSLFPTFIAVVEYKTTSLASKMLHLSQPTVTDHIHRLEQSCNVSLFHRSRQGMALTEKGQLLYGHAKKVLSLIYDIETEISDSSQISGCLSLAASTTIASYIMPLLIQGFVKRYPTVHVHMSSLNTADTLESVHRGSVKLGLMEGYSSSNYVEIFPFIEDILMLVGDVSSNYSLSSVQNLKEYPLIWREPGSGTREVIEKALMDAGVDLSGLSIPFQLGSTQAIKHSVEAGLGLSFLSRWSIGAELQRGQLKELPIPGFSIRRWFYWAKPLGKLDALHLEFYNFSTKVIEILTSTPLENWVI